MWYLLFLGTFVITPVCISGQDDRDLIRKTEKLRTSRMAKVLRTRQSVTEESHFDVVYYGLDLSIDPASETVSGNVTTKGKSLVEKLEIVTLDLYENMEVDSIVTATGQLSYSHENNQLTVNLEGEYEPDEIFDITVYYRGHPADAGGFHSFAFGDRDGVPLISTLSEPFGAPAWWPCKDDPADKADSVDIIITVPEDLIVASNGTLESITRQQAGTRTFFWKERYPITTYLVSLAITDYEVFSDYYHYSEEDSMEVQFYVYPEHLEVAVEDFNVTVPMLEHFSTVFGEYPFVREKYGMAAFQWGGAMEHQTCTSYGARLIRGDHRYDWIVAHELAHQWFGDSVTMKYWSHIWLNEGFATYAEALWTEGIKGEKAYRRYMQTLDAGVFPTSVYVQDSTRIDALFSRTVYDKGGWVLHMLRHVMGDRDFFSALQVYASAHASVMPPRKTSGRSARTTLEAALSGSSDSGCTASIDRATNTVGTVLIPEKNRR